MRQMKPHFTEEYLGGWQIYKCYVNVCVCVFVTSKLGNKVT